MRSSILRFVLFVGVLETTFVTMVARDNKTYEELFIEQFVDAYRQAYDKQNIDFISKVFSEQALIVTQTMTLRTTEKTYKNRGKKYVIVTESKKKYLKRLKKIFDTSTYLRLEVSVPIIEEHKKYKGLYGVYLTQRWEGDSPLAFSGELHQKGCILLIIDFSMSKIEPTIHVRTWQPDEVLKTERKFHLYDFDIL